MSLRKIEKYLEILLYFYSREKVTRNELVQEFEMPYSTLSSLFKKWINQGYLTRMEMQITYAGEERFAYEITNKGKKFLKQLQEILDNGLKEVK